MVFDPTFKGIEADAVPLGTATPLTEIDASDPFGRVGVSVTLDVALPTNAEYNVVPVANEGDNEPDDSDSSDN